MKAALHNFGCKVNSADSRGILTSLETLGFSYAEDNGDADVIIVNTCAVTNEAARQCRQTVRSLKTRYPNTLIAVTGCYAQIIRSEGGIIEGADILTGTTDRDDTASLITQAFKDRPCGSRVPLDFTASKITAHAHLRTRAVIKIQDGCRMKCSYCIIPSARGELYSKPEEQVVDEVNELTADGYPEITLSGIHLNNYRSTDGGSIISLLRRIQKDTDAKRIRLGSFEVHLITPENVEALVSIDCLCRHFHVSLQSGSDRILSLMKRHYTASSYLSRIDLLRETFPDATVTTDVIAGFPSETRSDLEDSAEIIEKAAFEGVHIFPFSPKKGTPAASMAGAVQNRVKKERAAYLAGLASEVSSAAISRFAGTEQEVVLETEDAPGVFSGFTRNYIRFIYTGQGEPSHIVHVSATGQNGSVLTGQQVDMRTDSSLTHAS